MRRFFPALFLMMLLTALAAVALADVDLTADHFPDAVFLNIVKEHDTDGSGALSVSEIENVTSLSIENKGISILKGIEHFTSLEYLNCAQNSLSSLDVSALNALTQLDCKNNQIAELILPEETETLSDLSIGGNRLKKIDLGAYTALISFNQDGGQNFDVPFVAKDYYCYYFVGLGMEKAVFSDGDYDSETGLLRREDNVSDFTYTYPTGFGNTMLNAYVTLGDSRSVPGMAVFFPDDIFRAYVFEHFDADGNGWLSYDERASVTQLQLAGMELASLEGIEYFINLEGLDCSRNHLWKLDLNGLNKLKSVSAAGQYVKAPYAFIGNYMFLYAGKGLENGYFEDCNCEYDGGTGLIKRALNELNFSYIYPTGSAAAPYITVNVSADEYDPTIHIGGNCGYVDYNGYISDYVIWELYENGRMVIRNNSVVRHEIGDFIEFDYPWLDYREFITSIVIMEGVTRIGCNAFNYFTNLSDVTLPDSLQSIGDHAFQHCFSLQTLTIPNDKTSFGNHVFFGDEANLTIICGIFSVARVYAENYGIKTLVNHDYVDGWCTICGDPENLIAKGPCGTDGSNVEWFLIEGGKLILRGVRTMADFSEDNSPWCGYNDIITTAEVRSDIANIGAGAFYGCRNLEQVVILNSGVTSIGKSAFGQCGRLKEVTLPDTLESIGAYAFADCTSLTEISIPDSVVGFGGDVFLNHNADLTITCGCNSYARTYAEANGIKTSLKHNIVDKVCIDCDLNVIASGDCGPLNNNNIPLSDTVWKLYDTGKLIICGNPVYASAWPVPIGDFTDRKLVPWKNYRDSITSIEIKDSVSYIGMHAFSGCTNLERVVIPNGVTDIGENAFRECTKLVDVTLPNSLKSIGESAFGACCNLQTLTIPDSVTTIGALAFSYCFQLQTVTIPDSVETIAESAFCDCGKDLEEPFAIKCSCGSLAQAYAEENGINTSITHKYVNEICTGCRKQEYLKKGNCGENVTYKLHNDGTLTVSGSGRMADYTSTDTPHPWYEYRSSVRSAVVESGVTYIGNYAFYGLFNLSSVSIANSVTEIGAYAFSGSEMPDIEIPGSVTSVGRYAFLACGSLTEVTIPGSITATPEGMFYRCKNLKKVTIESGVEAIGANTFSTCESLTDVSIPDSVKTVGFAAFMDCKGLTEIAIPESVENIGDRAFYGCASLKDVNIPEGVTSIGESTFYNCAGLTEIVIPDGVTSIGNSAFRSCAGLKKITIPDSVESFGTDVFLNCSEEMTFDCKCDSHAGEYAYKNGILLSIPHHFVEGFCAVCGRPEYVEGDCGDAGSNLTWRLGTNRTLIVSGSGAMADYADGDEIPWYDLRSSVRTVQIQTGVTSIGDFAFYGCSNLKSVLIADTVTGIGANAFGNDISLSGIKLPDGITVIGSSAFESCSALTEITLPGRLTAVENRLFFKCRNLKKVMIGSCAESIGYYAFASCPGLTEISIPDSVVSFGASVFYDHGGDLTITCVCGSAAQAYAENNSIQSLIQHNYVDDFCTDCGEPVNCIAQGECGAEDDNVLWFLIDGGKLYIRGTGNMADYARAADVPWHSYCEAINSVKIQSGVTYIGMDAFYGNTNLTRIEIPNSVTSVGKYTFEDCGKLGEVTIPGSIETIPEGMFYDCKNLTKVTIRNGVTGIDKAAFAGCDHLTEISIPASVTDINPLAFWGHSEDLTINCSCLMPYVKTYAEENGILYLKQHDIVDGWCTICGEPENCTAKGECGNADDSIKWFLTGEGKLYIRGAGAMADYSAEKPVEWYDLRNSVKSAEIESGVTRIGKAAFSDCENLASVSIPNTVAAIGESAFSGSGLAEITIPDSVETIGKDAFLHCADHFTIECSCTSYAKTYARDNVIYHSLQHGNLSDGWCTVCGEPENCTDKGECGNAGDNVKWFLTGEGKLYLRGAGAMADYSKRADVPWYSKHRQSIRTVEIQSGVTRIGDSAFTMCGSLSSISIPDTVTGIGAFAFYEDRALTGLTIPNNVTEIGHSAFEYCEGLTEFTLPSGITAVADHLFDACLNLKKVTIPSKVTSIGNYAFCTCCELTDINIPYGVTSIGESTFWNCESLTGIHIPDSLKSIGKNAFCFSGLTEISIPSSVIEIGENVFEDVPVTIICNCASTAKTYADNNGIPASLLHDEIVDPCLPATRTASGLTEGKHCGRCGEVLIAQEEIAAFTDIPVLALPNAVKAIEAEAFTGSPIECAVLPDGCESIGSKAFADCEKLKLAEIPASVTSIAQDAFDGSTDVAIVTTAGSTAEAYAIENGLPYRTDSK